MAETKTYKIKLFTKNVTTREGVTFPTYYAKMENGNTISVKLSKVAKAKMDIDNVSGHTLDVTFDDTMHFVKMEKYTKDGKDYTKRVLVLVDYLSATISAISTTHLSDL